MNRLPFYLMGFALLLALGQAIHYFPLLPDRVGSHFDAAGTPNGWMSKEWFFGIHFGVLVLLITVFSGIPWLVGILPRQMINLPNRDYWLADERIEATRTRIRTMLGGYGAATSLFLVGVFQLALMANLERDGKMAAPYLLGLLIPYLLASLVWTVVFIRGFLRPGA